MPTVAQYLDGLLVGNAAVYQGLWIFPVCLVSAEFEKTNEEFASISESLKKGKAFVYETGEMDRVRIINRGSARLAGIESETLIGGAQNRILNGGMVISPGIEADLPSSCVEVKRWDCVAGAENPVPADKAGFKNTDFGFASLRRLKIGEAIHSLRVERKIKIDQQKVWEHIVKQFGLTGAKSGTLDLHDLYEFYDSPLKMFSYRFTVVRNQVGMIAFHDKRTWFMDIFANRDLLFRNFKKLVRSHSFDALVKLESKTGIPSRMYPGLEEARDVFKKVKTAQSHEFKSGDSRHMFFSTSKFSGMAMLDESHLIHLAACSE
ncbi:MAG TPA: hypothetical protein PLN69_11880 [bacterium]|nr:hypothetical protein [bacterium]